MMTLTGTEFTQVATLVVEQELGLSHTDRPGLTYLASRLPFEPTMCAIATLAARAEELTDERTAQMDVAREFFAEAAFLDRLQAIASTAPQSRVIFGPQSLYTFMRLLIDYAYDAPHTDQSPRKVKS